MSGPPETKPRTWILDGVRVNAREVGSAAGPGTSELAALLGVEPAQVLDACVVRRSLDARARPPVFVLRMRVELDGAPAAEGPAKVSPDESSPETPVARPSVTARRRPVVIGAGPAGLFAALELARSGVPPCVLERGESVRRRQRSVARFRRDGDLDPQSNMVFGEGGAGAFSDGKIYTRARSPHARAVLRDLVDLGADPAILEDARPHLGTDVLARLLPRLRERLTELGCEIRFGAAVVRLEVQSNRLRALELADGERVRTDAAVLAVGHHARDTLQVLHDAGVPLEARPTAVGVRIEHRQRDVDRWMYGGPPSGDLPPASYRVVMRPSARRSRPVYSFCMCPGGVVVAAPQRDGLVVTNGMSGSRRSGKFANSGLVVPLEIEDYGAGDPLAGVRFLDDLEARCHDAAGGGFVAPAQRADDFVARRPGEGELRATYRPGIAPVELDTVLPAPVATSLRSALQDLDRRWRGFAGEDAVLVAVESRTSSPVRLSRGEDGQSVGVEGGFPAGEGAGFAGGILSSASDGVVAARCLASHLGRA